MNYQPSNLSYTIDHEIYLKKKTVVSDWMLEVFQNAGNVIFQIFW